GADDDEPPPRPERATDPPPGLRPADVDDHVVALAAPREVLLRVVDHAVGTERPRLLDVARPADRCHRARAESLRDLHRERADGAGRAVDEHALARLETAVVAKCLQRGQRADGNTA